MQGDGGVADGDLAAHHLVGLPGQEELGHLEALGEAQKLLAGEEVAEEVAALLEVVQGEDGLKELLEELVLTGVLMRHGWPTPSGVFVSILS